MAKTIGFHQKFNLDLDRLSNALRCIHSDPEMSQIVLAQCMSVNKPVAEGFSAWLRHTGLVTNVLSNRQQKTGTNRLTSFGELAYQYDPTLKDLGTQWILHYYLVTKREETSEAWFILMNDYLPGHLSFTSDQFRSYFSDLMNHEAKNRSALFLDPSFALSTYVRAEALGALNILEGQNKTYLVRQPKFPSTLVIGYILLDWWQHHYNHTDTLRFSQLLNEKEGLGRICLADVSQVRRFVRELAGLGYLSFSESQHEPVHRLYQDQPILLLERYYQRR